MKARRSLSLFMAMIMLLSSMIVSVFTVGVSAAETDPKKIDKVIVDMRSESAMTVNSEIYKHTPSEVEPWPNLGGLYEFDTDKNAMQLIYDECFERHSSVLPEWVRDGMRANYTNMLATVYDIDKSAIDADIDTLKTGYEALDMCANIGGMARYRLCNGE